MDSLTRATNKLHRHPRNRLLSILHDADWVLEAHTAYGLSLPLIPNERCGLWYVPPEHTTDTAYFKSTDGHTHQWQFSTRRLNFHLLERIGSTGIMLVDSTRRGKRMPDAVSKTVPIWCAVLNYIMMGPEHEFNWFFWPRQVLSESEAHSIIELIPHFATRVMELGLISRETLREKLQGKIMRPLWVYPGMALPFEPPVFEEFTPVICCVASERADDGQRQMRRGAQVFTYVQGAADDHELWANGLTPECFWDNVDKLMAVDGDELEQLMRELSLGSKEKSGGSITDVVQLTETLSVGTVVGDVGDTDVPDYDTVVLLSGEYNFKDESRRRYNCPPNKKGSNELRKHLPQIVSSIDPSKRTLIACDTGKDISIGVALAVLSSRYTLQWELTDNVLVTKDVIKKQLAKILEKKKVNPSRATLQSINSYLM